MTLKEYIISLEKLISKDKKVANYQVYYAVDEEGNEYCKVDIPPSLCQITDKGDVLFVGEDEKVIPNVVVIN